MQKDLLGRLQYVPIVNIENIDEYNGKLVSVIRNYTRFEFEFMVSADDEEVSMPLRLSIEEIKPFLRPLSSMTEEERWDFGRIFNSFEYLKLELLENGLSFHEIYDITGMCDITWNELNTAIDWLNSPL